MRISPLQRPINQDINRMYQCFFSSWYYLYIVPPLIKLWHSMFHCMLRIPVFALRNFVIKLLFLSQFVHLSYARYIAVVNIMFFRIIIIFIIIIIIIKFFFLLSIRHLIILFVHSFLFILEIPVIRSAEYKLPIIREICICMFSLYTKRKF